MSGLLPDSQKDLSLIPFGLMTLNYFGSKRTQQDSLHFVYFSRKAHAFIRGFWIIFQAFPGQIHNILPPYFPISKACIATKVDPIDKKHLSIDSSSTHRWIFP